MHAAADALEQVGQAVELAPALGTELAGLLHAPRGVPALVLDDPEQPRRLQAAVAEYDHRPVGRDGPLQVPQEDSPVRVPGVFHAAVQDFPGDGDGIATHDHADAQDVEAFAQVGDIDRQGQLVTRPQGQDPAQQGGEAGGDIEVAAFAAVPEAGLGGSLLVELGKTLAHGMVGPAKGTGQEERDSREAAEVGQDHGEDEDDSGSQLREPGFQFVLPLGKLEGARHRKTPGGWVRSIPNLADFLVAPSSFSSHPTSNRPVIILSHET